MRTAIIFAIFALVVVGFFFDVLLGGKVLLTTRPSLFEPWRTYAGAEETRAKTYRTDSMLTYLPRQAELSRGIARGRLPLWNPYILAGTPFFADPQARVLYPLAWLVAPLSAEKALGYDVAMHFLLALVGMYLFLRAIECHSTSAALGAFAYGFSSFFGTRMGHPTFVASAAWIPFFFYGFELAWRRRRAGTLLLALFFILGYLAGFPQVLLFGVAALVLYALVRAADQLARGSRRQGLLHAATSARIIGVAGGLALLVVAVQLLPFREFIKNSCGLGIGLNEMKLLYLSKPVLLLRALVPGLFGNPVDGTNWVPLIQGGIHPYNLGFAVYCGIGTLMVALGGLAFVRQSEHIRALLAILVASVAIGTSGIVLGWVWKAIPLFRYSQIDRISVLGCFALAALGGKGLSLFAASPARANRVAFVVVAGAVVVALAIGLAVFAVRGQSLLSPLKPVALTGGPYAEAGAERITAWAAGRHDLWAAYERSQIARSLAFAAAAFGLLVILAWRRVRTGRAAPLAVALLAAVVAADGLTAARAYYVSQPAGSVRATEGIKTLADLVGPEGTWRTLNREAATWVFPPNANELFGIEALRGRSTIVPQTYAYFLGGPNQASAAGRGGASGAGGAEPSLEAAGLMSARYLIRDSFDPAFASGVFGLIARRPGAASSIRLPNLGGDARLALCQAAGDTARVNVHIPDHARLDFYFGAPAGPSGVVLELSCQGPNGRVSFRKELPPPETGRWYDESLDLSSLGGEYAELVLTAARAGAGSATGPPAGESSGGNLSAAGPQPTGQGFTGAWGGLELVLADCRAEVCQRGYIVETGRAGIVSLTIAASAQDVPLEIATASGKILRWVAFPPYLRTRTIKVDMTAQERGSLAVTSDSAFTVVRSRLGPANSGVGLGDLVYAGDMYIFENPTAVEKAFVATGEAVRSLTEAGWAQAGGPGSGRPDMRCGKVRITSYEPERIALEVQADQEGWLVLQDGFYPGWRAVVDGRSEPIRVTEVGTRAVAVSAGQHAMVMEFKPESLRRGLVITVLGLAVGVLYAFAPRRKRSK